MNRALIYTLTLFLFIFMSGCSPTQTTSEKQDQNKTSPFSEEINLKIPEENYEQVFGDVGIKTIRAQLSDGRPWIELAISDKAEIFGFAPKNNGKHGELISYNLNTGKADELCAIDDGYDITFFKFNDNYLVWTETKNIYEDRASQIVVYDRKSKKPTVISKKEKISSLAAPEQIALGSDYVLWSTESEEQDKVKNKIMKYSLINRAVSMFREDAVMPIIGDYFIAWLGPEDEKLQNTAIFFNNLRDNSIKEIIISQNPVYINTDGTSIVCSGVDKSDSNLKRISIIKDGKVDVIKEATDDYFEFPEISHNFIGWRGTKKLDVFYRNSNKIAILTEEFARYSDVKVSDNYILWHSPVIKDENEAKQNAMEQGIYLSDLYILDKKDIAK